jgi:hypothetical protein
MKPNIDPTTAEQVLQPNLTTIYIVLVLAGIICLTIVGYALYSMYIAGKNIFQGSGVPISMAQMTLGSIHVTSQSLFGVLVITIITIFMLNGIIKAEAGLPLLSAISGYLLGKNFRDIAPSEKNRSKPDAIK